MMTDPLRCLSCHRPLSEADDISEYDAIQCACGVGYSRLLLNAAAPDEWDRALRRDGYIVARLGNDILVSKSPGLDSP